MSCAGGGGAVAAVAAAVVVSATGGAVEADTPRNTPAAIEVDREAAPPGRTELGFDGGAGVEGWGVTVAGGWLERPIELLPAGGAGAGAGEAVRPVRRRQTLALGGAVALGESVVLDARLAAAHQVGDRVAADARARDRFVLGDLRLGARLRVTGGDRRAMFVRGELTLPTGDDGDFAGEASWSLSWQLVGRVVVPGGIALAAAGGIRLRGAEVIVGDRLVGDEVMAAVGAAVPLPPVRPLWCGEQVKLTAEAVIAVGDDVGTGTGPSPAEVRLGVVTLPRPELAIGVRVGRGIGDEIGAPRARATLEVTYRGRPAARRPRAE